MIRDLQRFPGGHCNGPPRLDVLFSPPGCVTMLLCRRSVTAGRIDKRRAEGAFEPSGRNARLRASLTYDERPTPQRSRTGRRSIPEGTADPRPTYQRQEVGADRRVAAPD